MKYVSVIYNFLNNSVVLYCDGIYNSLTFHNNDEVTNGWYLVQRKTFMNVYAYGFKKIRACLNFRNEWGGGEVVIDGGRIS